MNRWILWSLFAAASRKSQKRRRALKWSPIFVNSLLLSALPNTRPGDCWRFDKSRKSKHNLRHRVLVLNNHVVKPTQDFFPLPPLACKRATKVPPLPLRVSRKNGFCMDYFKNWRIQMACFSCRKAYRDGTHSLKKGSFSEKLLKVKLKAGGTF